MHVCAAHPLLCRQIHFFIHRVLIALERASYAHIQDDVLELLAAIQVSIPSLPPVSLPIVLMAFAPPHWRTGWGLESRKS